MGKKKKLADTLVGKEEITIFSQHLKEALDKFDSFLDISDEDWEKVEKLYQRLCRTDSLLEKIKSINHNLSAGQEFVKAFPDMQEFKKTYEAVMKYLTLINEVEY